MTVVTDAIRELVEYVESEAIGRDTEGYRSPYLMQTALVRAWLDGKSTAGVAMSGADLEGILECVESAGGLLADFETEAINGPLNTRASWRVRAQRIRRAQFWAHAFEPIKPLPAPPPTRDLSPVSTAELESSPSRPSATYPPGDVDIFWTPPD